MTRLPRNRGGKAANAGAGKDLVPVLVAKVRGSQAVADKALKAVTADQAEAVLKPLVGPDTLLCIDGNGALRKASAKLGVTTKSIAVSYDGRISEGVYHVQAVNNSTSGSRPGPTGGCAAWPPSTSATTSPGCGFGSGSRGGAKPEHFIVLGLARQLINT